MSADAVTLEGPRAARYAERLAAALEAARANTSFPDLRVAAAYLRHSAGAVPIDVATGLPSYQWWARMRAEWLVARESGAGGRAAALRGLPPLRLGDLDVAERSADRRGRRLHLALDKVAGDGRLVRVVADLEVARSVDDEGLFGLLFPAADLPVELLLVRLAAARGVQAVERTSIGAVDLFADVEAAPGPPVDPPRLALGSAGALALSLAHATCAVDIAAGDNDVLSEAPGGDAARVRARLGTPALPQRLFLDRKLVANAVAHPLLGARVRARRTRTVLYEVEAP